MRAGSAACFGFCCSLRAWLFCGTRSLSLVIGWRFASASVSAFCRSRFSLVVRSQLSRWLQPFSALWFAAFFAGCALARSASVCSLRSLALSSVFADRCAVLLRAGSRLRERALGHCTLPRSRCWSQVLSILVGRHRCLLCRDLRSALWLPLFDGLADPLVVARLAAEVQLPWHGVFVWDHLCWRAPVRQVADAWITLSAIAVATEPCGSVSWSRLLPAAARLRSRGIPLRCSCSAVAVSPSVGFGSDRFGGSCLRPTSSSTAGSEAQMLDEVAGDPYCCLVRPAGAPSRRCITPLTASSSFFGSLSSSGCRCGLLGSR